MPLALFRDNPTLYLGLTVDDDQEMTPRLSLGSVPYAAMSQYSHEAATLLGAALWRMTPYSPVAALGMAAAVGCPQLTVYPRPRVGVLVTGAEIVALDVATRAWRKWRPLRRN